MKNTQIFALYSISIDHWKQVDWVSFSLSRVSDDLEKSDVNLLFEMQSEERIWSKSMCKYHRSSSLDQVRERERERESGKNLSFLLSSMGNSKSTPAAIDLSEHRYEPPRPTDSRSPCPALNVLANHGYLPRDGKNIPADVLQKVVQVGVSLRSLRSKWRSFVARREWVSVG